MTLCNASCDITLSEDNVMLLNCNSMSQVSYVQGLSCDALYNVLHECHVMCLDVM